MKSYPSIDNNARDYLGHYVYAFDKLDGSNFRAEWDRKSSKKLLSNNGFTKFGTRNELINILSPYAQAANIFMNKYSEKLNHKFNNDKDFRGIDKITVFGEFYGYMSLAGQHDWIFEENFDVTMFDVFLYKKDFMKPRDFIEKFGILGIPPVLYEGILNETFIQEIVSNYYDIDEGTVIKGVIDGKIFMTKLKTQKWLDKVREKYGMNSNLE